MTQKCHYCNRGQGVSYCYGCGIHICWKCDRNAELGGPGTTHKPDDHLIERGENLLPSELVSGDCLHCGERVPEWRGLKKLCSPECERERRLEMDRERMRRLRGSDGPRKIVRGPDGKFTTATAGSFAG